MKTHPPLSVCFEWAGYLVPRDVLLPVHNIVVRTEHCVQRTLPVWTVFFWDIIIRWTRGGGGTFVLFYAPMSPPAHTCPCLHISVTRHTPLSSPKVYRCAGGRIRASQNWGVAHDLLHKNILSCTPKQLGPHPHTPVPSYAPLSSAIHPRPLQHTPSSETPVQGLVLLGEHGWRYSYAPSFGCLSVVHCGTPIVPSAGAAGILVLRFDVVLCILPNHMTPAQLHCACVLGLHGVCVYRSHTVYCTCALRAWAARPRWTCVGEDRGVQERTGA